MNSLAYPTSFPAAAFDHAPATPPLELMEARRLRDDLAALLRKEQVSMADFLVALADFDRRRAWEPLGHASLFAFLHAGLGLSNSASFWRMSAARLLQRFPDLVEPLGDGRLCLSTTAELAKVLTEENRAELAPRFFGLSAREAREIAAELQPREAPPLRALVTAVDRAEARSGSYLKLTPLRSPTPSEASRTDTDSELLLTSEVTPTHPARDSARRNDVEPLTAELRRLHVTVDAQFLRMLDAARGGLSHSIPGASVEQVLKAGLELLLEKQARARGLVRRPRKLTATSTPIATSTQTATSTVTPTATPAVDPAPPMTEPLHRRTGPREHIPAAVRRAVWERDQGRCVWPLDAGGCCGSTHRLEFDHVVPWARGSDPTAGNLRLLCGRHNALAARLEFGQRWMGRYGRGSAANPDQKPLAGTEPGPDPSDQQH